MNHEQIVKELLKPTLEDVCMDYTKLKNWRVLSPLSNVGNLVVDWFTLEERLNTKMKSHVSFYDFLENFESIYKLKTGVARLYDLRPDMPHVKRVKYAYNLYIGNPTIFKPIQTLHILDILPCKVACLDPTAGWGGRAVGASAFGIPQYIGIDSNTNLREPYSRLCKFLESKSQTKILMLFMDALKVDYSELCYDLVITSYPYYNIEKYSNYTQYKTKRQMNELFYRPLTLEIYNNLLIDGHFALNVSPEIYEYIRSFMGDAHITYPLIARNRTEGYSELIYVWRK